MPASSIEYSKGETVSLDSVKKEPITKEKAIKVLLELVEKKKIVQSYLKGEITAEALSQKGIKLATPL